MVAPNTEPQRRSRTGARPSQHVSEADLRGTEHEPEHEAPRLRTRRRRKSLDENEFYIPLDEIPEGSSYEWKRFTVNGQEDPFYIARMREQGFEPVDPQKHPNWVPPGYNAPHIIKGGQILMERPMYLWEDATMENSSEARRQIIEAEQRLGKTPKDTMTRDYDGAKPKIVKEIGRMVNVTGED